MRIKNSSWCAKLFPCLFSGIRTGGRAFEVQIGFTSSHWQDNIVQQFHICGRCDHFFLFVGVLLRAVKCSGFRVYWLMLERTTEAMTEKNWQLWIHCFLGGTRIDKYFIKKYIFQNEKCQLTAGPSSPLGPLKERRKDRLLPWFWWLLPQKS